MKTGILRKKGDWYQVEYRKGLNTKLTDLPRTYSKINEEWVGKEIKYDTNSNGVIIKIECNGEIAIASMNSNSATDYSLKTKSTLINENKEAEIKNPFIHRQTKKFARAPYNFIPINDKIYFSGVLSSFDKYEVGKRSGFINLSIINLTPIFLRQISDIEDNFGYSGKFGISGSSMRGMIRTMAEILSYSKMSFYNKGYLYYRGSLITMDKIQAGMIEYDEISKCFKVFKCKYDIENNRRWQEKEIRKPSSEHNKIIFTTGKFGNKGYNKFEFFDVSKEPSYIINPEDEVYIDYINDKTAKKNPNIFDRKRNGKYPVFFQVNSNGSIKSIGTAKYHRIPYSKRTVDHLPIDHIQNEIDICESLFGIIKNKNEVNLSSKLHFGDLLANKFAADEDFLIKILASPKPTTYQHYIEQNDPEITFDWDSDRLIRGNKFYWHRKTKSKYIEENQNFDNLLIKYKNDYTYDVTWNEPWSRSKDNSKKTKSHTTRIKPIKEGAEFIGKIWFQNLSDIELGLLLTALEPGFTINADEKIAHKIGLGKPLGLGSIEVKVEDVQIFHNSSNGYFSSYEQTSNKIDKKTVKEIFISELKKKLNQEEIWDSDRLKQLKSMLTWNEKEVSSEEWLRKTRYMEITRGDKSGRAGNEYYEKPILPKPSQVKTMRDDKFVNKSS